MNSDFPLHRQPLRPVILSAFGPPALACLRCWGRAGLAAGMICVQGADEAPPRSRYLEGFLCLTREEFLSAEGLAAAAAFLDDFAASGLFCIDESLAAWLNDHRRQLPASATAWLPPNDMLDRALDKALQIEAARRVGLAVLPTYSFGAGAPRQEIPAAHFPLCLRPSAPQSVAPHFKMRNVASPAELREFLDTLEIRRPVIGQPFLNLPNLVVHGTRSRGGENSGLTGFLVERKFQGVTLTIRPFPLDRQFLERCADFTGELQLVGHYHFEFLHDAASGASHFLEINHRFGGTTAKVLQCGYPEPLYALWGQGLAARPSGGLREVTASSVKALVKSALQAVRGELTPLDYPAEPARRRLWATARCLLACRDEVLAVDDWPGTLAFYGGRLLSRPGGGRRG